MPFALSHKTSKKQLRRTAPSPLELRQEQLANPLPTPPLTGDSMAPQAGFKMFWKKKLTSPMDARPSWPAEPPRPILKSQPDNGSNGGPSIRFVGQRPPQVVVTSYERQSMYEVSAVPRAASTRRSSRPTSPSSTSFGARARVHSAPAAAGPLATPPMSSHVTTPPTAYVSTMQSRAPPPPSPYRPTHERRRSVTRTSTFPEQLPMTTDMAPRPPRNSSFFPTPSESTSTIAAIPMLNVIPATPQDTSDEFAGSYPTPRRSSRQLEEAVNIEEMDEVPLESTFIPSIDVSLDFSPIAMPTSLPSTDAFPTIEDISMNPLPSPPFESFSSLPSLDSQHSMPSSGSEASMSSSDSMSSIVSFPDVEEALGSMLASLSDNSLPSHSSLPTHHVSKEQNAGLGLGLGLDLPVRSSITTPTPTAPLSPRRRGPAPLDLIYGKQADQSAAPPCINHRVAFYGTARAAPNSPSSGIFMNDLTGEPMHFEGGCRDSISLTSEASDDDLHTASIISLTPVQGDRAVMVEVMLPEQEVEVGLAF